MIELELKYVLPPVAHENLCGLLRSGELAGTVRNHDIYYDTAQYDLFRQAVFVRIRNNTRLQFKFNETADTTHVQCIERSFPLTGDTDTHSEIHALFKRFLPAWQTAESFTVAASCNGLRELATIQNIRTLYRYEHISLSLDHVEGLGDFLELETVCEKESETPAALERLRTFAAQFRLQPLNVGYVELWLRRHHPAIYHLGRYQ